MLKKHHDVKTKGKLVDMSDMESDALVMWQKKYAKKKLYWILCTSHIYISFFEQVLCAVDAIVLDRNPNDPDENSIGWITGQLLAHSRYLEVHDVITYHMGIK